MYTTHGYYIPDSTDTGYQPKLVHCGGITQCERCKAEVAAFQKGVDTPGVDLTPQQIALRIVQRHIDSRRDEALIPHNWRHHFCSIVWYTKTLQNWKALVTTSLGDDRYYEVTYNGELNEAYIDEYLKAINVVVPANEF